MIGSNANISLKFNMHILNICQITLIIVRVELTTIMSTGPFPLVISRKLLMIFVL